MANPIRPTTVTSNINVTPMVDVMLVLLIIFMVITPMLAQKIPVNLAQTRNRMAMPDADKDEALVIAVLRDGSIFLGAELTTAKDLSSRIKAHVDDHTTKTVFIRADARARYEFVVNVVDNVRAAGVGQLGLLTEQVHPHSAL